MIPSALLIGWSRRRPGCSDAQRALDRVGVNPVAANLVVSAVRPKRKVSLVSGSSSGTPILWASDPIHDGVETATGNVRLSASLAAADHSTWPSPATL